MSGIKFEHWYITEVLDFVRNYVEGMYFTIGKIALLHIQFPGAKCEVLHNTYIS